MKAENKPFAIPIPFGAAADPMTITIIPVPSQKGITQGAASFSDGFPNTTFLDPDAGGVAPRGADFNGILNAITQSLTWVQSGGSFQYNPTFSADIFGYPLGAILQRADATGGWINTIDQNTSNPDTGGAGWLPYGGSTAPLSLVVSNANITLTALQAASPVVYVSGALTADVTIYFPNWNGAKWLLVDTSTGAFNVSVSTTSGSALPLSAGANEVYGDGTNILPISQSVNSGGIVKTIIAGENVTVDSTDPANPVVSSDPGIGGVPSVNGITSAVTIAQGSNVTITQAGSTLTISATGGGVSQILNPVPDIPWFGPSGTTVVAAVAGQPAGDPFIVWDASNSVFRMFYFRNPSGVATYVKTAPTLEGPWGAETAVAGLTNYHKFVVLVDVDGNPVQIGGSFHGYAVYFSGTNASKTIYHFTAPTLDGTWTVGANVVPKGASGSWDGFANDACMAVYDSGEIYLWYMAEPDVSQSDFGFASRMMIAKSSAPDSGFVKNYSTAVLTPSSSAGWDYGWLGGMQVRRISANDPYVLFYNAGNTRPTTGGDEPNTSLDGIAYSTSLDGPWVKSENNPILHLTNIPSDAVENVNIWRCHYAFDSAINGVRLFYNTGYYATAGESVTFARDGAYAYQYFPSPSSGGQIMTLTTAEQQITNSPVNVQPGVYRVTTRLNIIGDASGTNPGLNITTWIRTGAGNRYCETVDFIGNYPYENRDVCVEFIIPISAPTYIDASIQVTAGTPLSTSYGRNLRTNVEKIS